MRKWKPQDNTSFTLLLRTTNISIITYPSSFHVCSPLPNLYSGSYHFPPFHYFLCQPPSSHLCLETFLFSWLSSIFREMLSLHSAFSCFLFSAKALWRHHHFHLLFIFNNCHLYFTPPDHWICQQLLHILKSNRHCFAFTLLDLYTAPDDFTLCFFFLNSFLEIESIQ